MTVSPSAPGAALKSKGGFIQNATATANAVFGVGLSNKKLKSCSAVAVAFCMNDFSLFYLDHPFANAAKPRSRSV